MMNSRLLVFLPLVACAVLCRGANRIRDVGLVLSGGGARGAYEVGVWAAMCEAGLDKRVCCISGTSVGSINAVLFASVSNPALCERFWLEVVPNFAKPNEKHMLSMASDMTGREDITTITARILHKKAEALGLDVSDLSSADEEEARARAIREWKANVATRGAAMIEDSIKSFHSTNDVLHGFADVANFRRLLSKRIPDKWAQNSIAVYATALKKGVWNKEVFRIDHQQKDRVLDMLIASSSIPYFFDSSKVDGKLYVDGGWEAVGGDNVPISPILENHHEEIKVVIVVYLQEKVHNRSGQNRVRSAAEKKGVRLIEIVPSKDTGGIGGAFDTMPETARRLIELGRKDAREALTKSGMTKVGK